MDVRQITDRYFVAPQLDPGDMSALPGMGITRVICNRPDPEVPPSHAASQMEAAATEAGLDFVILPLTHQTFTPENIDRHRAAVDTAEGACLAYCASGTRSTIAWALGQAAHLPADEIIEAAARGGYDLAHLRPTLDALRASAQDGT